MPEMKRYSGGCHCGKVRYEAETDLGTVLSCNCSICSKKALLLTFVPQEKFKLLSGESELSDYQFNHHVIHHLFCKSCGTQSFSRAVAPDGKAMVALNVRCLDDIDIGALTLTPFDGRSR
jgi:hypothetical protein